MGATFDRLFAEHSNTRIIVATFASNVDRVQQIINTSYKYGRKVVVEGRSMVNIISVASEPVSYTHLDVYKRQEYLDATLRFSMSEFTTEEEIDYTLETLYNCVPMLRKYTRH